MERVADLMTRWAEELDLEEEDRLRWRALGFLHDALRDADPETLRRRVPPPLRDLPDPILHGPAAAERLRVDGVEDGAFLRAVAAHTLGDPRLDRMGRALYAADFLEPGRDLLNAWREELRARMPADEWAVVRELLGARVAHLLEVGSPIRPETVAFWNSLVEDR